MSRSEGIGSDYLCGAPAVAQLRQVLSLVEQIAGGAAADSTLMQSEVARFPAAYDKAPEITRRRFDALASEAASAAAAGIEMLIGRARTAEARIAAADCLAAELRHALGPMGGLLGVVPHQPPRR
jgi:secreted protein with Ig-like and vWFA domain